MENNYEKFVGEVEGEAKKNARRSGTETWRAILFSLERIPQSLRHAFVVQILVSILDGQEVSNEQLGRALGEAVDAVQRVQEAQQFRHAA